MQENLALAIKNAVENDTSNIIKKSNENLKEFKKPDLFSLTNETELFQNEKGITIKIDRSKDSKLTDFGKATLLDRYLNVRLIVSRFYGDLLLWMMTIKELYGN